MDGSAATQYFLAGDDVLELGLCVKAHRVTDLGILGLSESTGFSKWMAMFEESLRGQKKKIQVSNPPAEGPIWSFVNAVTSESVDGNDGEEGGRGGDGEIGGFKWHGIDANLAISVWHAKARWGPSSAPGGYPPIPMDKGSRHPSLGRKKSRIDVLPGICTLVVADLGRGRSDQTGIRAKGGPVGQKNTPGVGGVVVNIVSPVDLNFRGQGGHCRAKSTYAPFCHGVEDIRSLMKKDNPSNNLSEDRSNRIHGETRTTIMRGGAHHMGQDWDWKVAFRCLGHDLFFLPSMRPDFAEIGVLMSSGERYQYTPFLLPWEYSGMVPKRLSTRDPFVLAPVYGSSIRRMHEVP
ncbi:hypothetical protein BDM02DRAFT_3258806 [Thelephora ganbajun]|uniref:Uncharacterized protein n=1 Tax=Thelephora ganbajun TaxID=370292 RepID=A0ACB6ZQ42_THEGA|nr:hypothetical protein BDM02DRAFT_3258806 [Thelephora ganbajun]